MRNVLCSISSAVPHFNMNILIHTKKTNKKLSKTVERREKTTSEKQKKYQTSSNLCYHDIRRDTLLRVRVPICCCSLVKSFVEFNFPFSARNKELITHFSPPRSERRSKLICCCQLMPPFLCGQQAPSVDE